MIEDPTIEVELIKPHQVQQEIIDLVLDEENFITTVVCGRQIGKTTLGENLSLYWGFNEEASHILWVSPTDQQAQKVYREVYDAIQYSGLVKSRKGTSGQMEIILVNDTKIRFRGALSGDNLRGDSVTHLILDEGAFMKRDTVEGVLLPTLSVTGKKCVILTTPKGKNWVYDYYLKGISKEKGYAAIRYSSLESPLMNERLLEIFKNSFSPVMYRQEILAEFVDVGSVFTDMSEVAILPPLGNKRSDRSKYFYGGIDIGLVSDATVFSIIDEKGNLVEYMRWVNIPAPRLIKEIIVKLSQINFKKVYIELNNQGLPIFQHFEEQGFKELEGFNTTSKSKPEIIEDLIFAINTQNMKMIKNDLLIEEFENFKFQQTARGHTQYLAENGYNDDIVMSVAIARKCFKDYSKKTGAFSGYKL